MEKKQIRKKKNTTPLPERCGRFYISIKNQWSSRQKQKLFKNLSHECFGYSFGSVPVIIWVISKSKEHVVRL